MLLYFGSNKHWLGEQKRFHLKKTLNILIFQKHLTGSVSFFFQHIFC